jgi:hypothetical protein
MSSNKILSTAEIIFTGVNGWDVSTAKRLRFSNEKRLYGFAIYYTRIHDCLVRTYDKYGVWTATYCNGTQVWNCY